MTDLSHTTSDGLVFDCGPYSYRGSYHDRPRERYVECEIEDGDYHGSCCHFVELTRADLMALLALLDEAEKRDDE